MITRAAILCVVVCAAPPARAGDAANGQIVAERWCNACHVILQKDAGWHNGNVAPRFTLLTKTSEAELRALLRSGHQNFEALKKIADSEINDIAAHIQQLKPEEQ